MAGSTRANYKVTVAWIVALSLVLIAIAALPTRSTKTSQETYITQFTKLAWRISGESNKLEKLYGRPEPDNDNWVNQVKISVNKIENQYQSFIKNTPAENFENPILGRIKINIQASCGKLEIIPNSPSLARLGSSLIVAGKGVLS